MASEAEHFTQAEHNLRFFGTFNVGTTAYRDWATTALFYSALHYIRAVAARHGQTNISSHGEIDTVFRVVPAFTGRPDIRDDYRQLKDDSRAARYDMKVLSASDVRELHDQELVRIREFTRMHLGI